MSVSSIIILGSSKSIHLQRWANGFAGLRIETYLVSMDGPYAGMHKDIKFLKLPFSGPLGYILNVIALKKILRRIKPDLTNVHYATGYGLLARLANACPTLLSVWGSDIYDFPKKSPLHYELLRGNLKKATAIASTSRCMARRTSDFFSHPTIFVTPFGIDLKQFYPSPKPAELSDFIVVGTVKTLDAKYGVDTLIRTFALTWEMLSRPPNVILEICGGGPDRRALEELISKLDISSQVTFFGAIPHEQVPVMLNRLDIYVALSRFESFGVAILEAAACEKPVLVSNAEGLAEVVRDGVNGLVVPADNPEAAAEALLKLVKDSDLRIQMGKVGRQHVIDNYSWAASLDLMLEAQAKSIELGKISK